MKVLLACEESQTVCKEFRKLGHEAYSCDIQECSGGHPEWHLQKDIFEVIDMGWDMMIAFPPCTHLAVSGAAWFEKKIADGRQQQGVDFFMKIINAPIQQIAVENPIGIMSSKFKKPDQIIQPYFFGDPYKKSTCLWLKNLPLLHKTNAVDPIFVEYNSSKTKSGKSKYSYMWKVSTQNNNVIAQRLRSKTPDGLAQAMAEQWSAIETSKPSSTQLSFFYE